MKKKYDTQLFYEINKKLELKFQRREERIMLNSWSLSQFIDKTASFYYKNELLNTINYKITEEEVLPKDIFILNSFNPNTIHKNLKAGEINLSVLEDIKKLYHLGEPVSFLPNMFLDSLNNFFELFRVVYTKTNQSKYIHKISKNILEDVVLELSKSPISLNEIRKLFLDSINVINVKAENSKEKKFREKADQEKISLEKIISNNILNWEKEKIIIESQVKLNQGLMDKSIKKEDISLQMKPRYNEFFNKFEVNNRPIIGVYDEKTFKIEILCIDFINQEYFELKNSRFFDYKSVGRNSPVTVTLAVGVTMLFALIGIFKKMLEEKNKKKAYMELKGKNDRRKEEIASEIQKLEEQIRITQENCDMLNMDGIVSKVDNDSYIGNEIAHQKNDSESKMNREISQQKMTNITTSIVDIT